MLIVVCIVEIDTSNVGSSHAFESAWAQPCCLKASVTTIADQIVSIDLSFNNCVVPAEVVFLAINTVRVNGIGWVKHLTVVALLWNDRSGNGTIRTFVAGDDSSEAGLVALTTCVASYARARSLCSLVGSEEARNLFRVLVQ